VRISEIIWTGLVLFLHFLNSMEISRRILPLGWRIPGQGCLGLDSATEPYYLMSRKNSIGLVGRFVTVNCPSTTDGTTGLVNQLPEQRLVEYCNMYPDRLVGQIRMALLLAAFIFRVGAGLVVAATFKVQ